MSHAHPKWIHYLSEILHTVQFIYTNREHVTSGQRIVVNDSDNDVASNIEFVKNSYFAVLKITLLISISQVLYNNNNNNNYY